MKTKTKVIRVKYSTWKTIRKCFPGKRNETIAEYLERVVDFLLLNEEIPNIRKCETFTNKLYPNYYL